MPAARHVCSYDHVRIAVHDLGGSGPPLVLAHATGFHGRVFSPLAARLGSQFRCVAPDLRGHGDSGVPSPVDFDWRGFGRDVLAVVDGVGGGAVRGVGHSSGATALLLAEAERPGTFAGLWLYEPIIVPADPPLGRDPDAWLAASARRRRARFGSRAEALEHYGSRPPLGSFDPLALREYVEHGFREEVGGGVGLKCSPEHEALVYEMATAHDCFGRLSTVRCPVWLARGGRSEAFLPDRSAAVAARLPDVRCEVHPELGHFGPLEDPAAVARAVARAFGGG